MNENGFSLEWESIYKSGDQYTLWPWSDLVSLVSIYFKNKKDISKLNVLELGCGVGANIPFFKSLGVNYYAIEGSETAVNHIHMNFPDLSNSVIKGDFTKSSSYDFNLKFDLVVDRSAVTLNTGMSIKNTMDNVLDILKPEGIFIGIDWFSTNHSDFTLGTKDSDDNTYFDIPYGQFAGVGRVHFFNEKEFKKFFLPGFEILMLKEKIDEVVIPRKNHKGASYNFVLKK